MYPCRSAYTADNETIEGIRSSLEEMKENENAEDEEETRETFRREEIDDDFPDTSEGEPTQSGPKHVDCEPFPQEVVDENTRLREQERELAWTYDYIPTELDKSFHAIDQYGVRIQRTTRPPYISPDEWITIKGAARDRILKDFDKGVKELKTLRARIRELEIEIDDSHARGGVRLIRDRRDAHSSAAAVERVGRSSSPVGNSFSGSGGSSTRRQECGGRDSFSACNTARWHSRDSFPACVATKERTSVNVAMPVIESYPEHRERDDPSVPYFYACTARTVDRTERSWNAEAKAALKKEWDRLRACGDKGCWDEANPRERSDVENEARKKGQVAHFGMVFDICVEKNHHLPAGSPGRKFKGRAVYQGNNVRDQDGNWAIFQDLASCPSTMAASKVADFYSLSPGHDGEQADAEMAYTQAEFHGPTTWVGIPKEQWPSNWYDAKGKPKYRFPVCKLMKALYGHPDSGGLWEKHCDAHLQSIGFKEIASWRSVYFHDELRVLLVVYVDDFKMAGPKKGLCEAWRRIRLKIKVEDPTPFGLFLCCRHEIGEVRLGTNGPKVRTMPTPFLTTPCGDDINAPFTTGPSLTCPWCRGCFPESLFSKGSAQSKRTRYGVGGSSSPACADVNADPPSRGRLPTKRPVC